jgi:replicative DNA helicase
MQDYHSPEAEQAIIGGLLRDNDYYDVVSNSLAQQHFYNPINSKIYIIISDRLTSGHSVDAIYVKNQLTMLEVDVDLAEYLSMCVHLFTGDENVVKSYSEIVIDYAKRREADYLTRSLQDKLNDNEQAIDTVLQDHVADIDAVMLDGNKQLTKSETSKQLSDTFIADLNADKEQASCYSGYFHLDQMLGGFVPGRVYVMAGRPSMGKSAVALNIAKNVAMQRKGVVFLSLEMTNSGQSERIISSIGATTYGPHNFPIYSQLRHAWRENKSRDKIQRAADTFAKLPIEWEEGVGLNLNNIKLVTNRAIRSLRASGSDLKLLIIDHIGHVAGTRPGQSNYEKVTEVSNALIAIAKQYEVPVLALCQLSRAAEQRDDKRPQLSDLRESGHIEQDASCVIGIYRDYYYAEREARNNSGVVDNDITARLTEGQNKLEMIVTKNRHGNIGEVNLYCVLSRMFIDNPNQDYRGRK